MESTATRSAGRRKGCPPGPLTLGPRCCVEPEQGHCLCDPARQGREDGGCTGQEVTLGTSTQAPAEQTCPLPPEERCPLRSPSHPPAGLLRYTAVPSFTTTVLKPHSPVEPPSLPTQDLMLPSRQD